MPTLVITDLDSAEKNGHHKKAEPFRNAGLISGNYAITGWLIKKDSLDELLDLPEEKKVFPMESVCDYQIRIAYQGPIEIDYSGNHIEALPRTFEDSLIYTNWNLFSELSTSEPGQLLKRLKEEIDKGEDFDKIKTAIFEELKKSDVKAEFALDLIYSIAPDTLLIPQYITEGLKWMESILCTEG